AAGLSASVPVGSREQERHQQHTGRPQDEEHPVPDLPAPGVVAEGHAEELERPQLDTPRPLAEQQVNHKGHDHRRRRRQEPQMNEAQAQVETSRSEVGRGATTRPVSATRQSRGRWESILAPAASSRAQMSMADRLSIPSLMITKRIARLQLSPTRL